MTKRFPVLLLAALALGCGGFPGGGRSGGAASPACGPATCEGCCSGTRCLLGDAVAACGNSGAQCEDCGAGTCQQKVCKPPPQTRPFEEGSCVNAPVVRLDAGYEGDTTGYAHHEASSCISGPRDTSDFIVALDVPQSRRIAVTVTPLDPDFTPVVDISSACSAPASLVGFVYGCAVAEDAGLPVTKAFRSASAPPAYAVVSGAGGTTGRFRLDVSMPGESCAEPFELSDENALVAGTTVGAGNDSTGSCGGAIGPDYVTAIKVTVRSNLVATVPATASGSQPVLYLQKSCGGEELACSKDNFSSTTHTLEAYDLAPGTYYLWTDDDWSGNTGKLDVQLIPVVAGDSCGAATPLQFSLGADGGVAQVAYNAFALKPNTSLSCGDVGSRDGVFTFTTTRAFDLEATQNSYSALALRGPSCDGTEFACADQTLHVSALPAGTWYLWSQSATTSARLDVTLRDPRPGESCYSPRALAFTGGADGGDAFVQGTLLGSWNDATSTCGGGGPDEVFEFTTAQILDFRADVTGIDFQPVLSLRYACAGSEVACSPGASAAQGELAVGSLNPGTYWLWVDSPYMGTQYSLAASLTPPVAADTCTNPGALSLSSPSDGGIGLSASVSGTTASLFHNTAGSCGGSGSPDAVYAFTLSAPATVTATAAGSGGLRPVVYLRQTCATTELACGIAPAVNASASVTASLGAGTYYVWVDGLGATEGAFTLEVNAQ